jgi:hypothetical protein
VAAPFDPHLADDTEVDLDRLSATRDAYLLLVATMGSGFSTG